MTVKSFNYTSIDAMFEYADLVPEEPSRGLRNIVNTESRNIREEAVKAMLRFYLGTFL
jgi:hypothetical protein